MFISHNKKSHIRLAVLLICFGILVACTHYFKISFIYKLWPTIPLIMSSGFITMFALRKKQETAFLSVGIYVSCFAILALYLNFSGWHQLSFLWPLFILFLSMVYFCLFAFCEKRVLYLFMGLFLLSVTLSFFLLFHLSASLWWMIFIFLGLSILISERFGKV